MCSVSCVCDCEYCVGRAYRTASVATRPTRVRGVVWSGVCVVTMCAISCSVECVWWCGCIPPRFPLKKAKYTTALYSDAQRHQKEKRGRLVHPLHMIRLWRKWFRFSISRGPWTAKVPYSTARFSIYFVFTNYNFHKSKSGLLSALIAARGDRW